MRRDLKGLIHNSRDVNVAGQSSKGVRMKPVVTIGMCLRNCERILSDAIDSIIEQDFPHELMEIIFVDDGSEDNTLRIVTEYVSRMDIEAKVFQTKWQGLGPARNLIVSNADGEYIIWVDADEILTKDYVNKQVEFMEQNPNVGITAGVVQTITGNLILNLELIPGIVDHMLSEKPRSHIWKSEKLPGTGGAAFRVKALRQVNGFDERLKGVGEDQDVAKRIRNASWSIRLNNATFYERHGGMSTLNDLWKKYLWYGYGNQKLYRKNRELFSLLRMSPPAGFMAGLFYSLVAYKLLHQKEVFLLPFHFSLKMTAWTLGFIKGQISS
jgi:glycosyltransferase involved in cell wall biosynthesis